MSKKKKSPLYAAGQVLLRMICKPLFRLNVIGKENIPADGAFLLCSNHVSAADPILLGIVQPRQMNYMAKAELFQNKLLGALLRGLGAFPVERGTGGADSLAHADKLLEEDAAVGVFIEGTRSKTGELLRPKTGAALLCYRSHAPVVPVCITAEGGKPKLFHRTEIRFGKPMTPDIPEQSSMHLRRASRDIMGEITALRAESVKSMGLALPAAASEQKEDDA